MSVLTQFRDRKSAFLREPAELSGARRGWGELGETSDLLLQMYALFDGEKMWGAWFPGFRIASLAEVAELMEMTADSWEWLEEERGEKHPMRNFIPFIASSGKTSLGPVFDARSELHDHVVEYRYETGEVRIWSKSLRQFLDAFFELSLLYQDPLTSLQEATQPRAFSRSDVEFLSRWPDVVFPVINEPTRDVSEF